MEDITFGKYRFIAELGHGGMADVFLAVQAGPACVGFRKLIVVKRLRQNLAEEPEFVEMLLDEARIAARLNHPNVVQTNEVEQVGNNYLIAMEYLDGQPLHRIQQRSAQHVKEGKARPITNEQQYIILMDVLAGLHHAHELTDFDGTPLEIVHRDVTPHNVFVTYTGQVKVVDFGVAKAAGRASETRQGVVKGKLRYMAPEQAVGQPVDRRADLFSVGVMLWEVAVGRRMWKGKDDTQIVKDLVAGRIPSSPREVDPSVPEGIDRICTKALAARPADRYATADDLRSDLEQCLSDLGQLVAARRQLAPALSDLFKESRDEMREIIEKQLARLREPSDDFYPVHIESAVPSETLPSQISPSLQPHSRSAPSSSLEPPVVVDPVPEGRQAHSSRVRFTLGIAAFATVLGGVLLIVVALTREPRTAQASHALDRAHETVNVNIRVTPVNAQVTIDDAPPRPAPVGITVPKDDRDHRLVVAADGFVTKSEVMRFASDVTLSIDLAPAEVPSSSTSVTRPRPGAPKVRSSPAGTPPPRDSPPRPAAPPTPAAPTPAAPAQGAPASAQPASTASGRIYNTNF
ncbi:MAG TPA: serine/threonine-protein kinase [Labilithrix sp.]|nr:serine/threonine-protein kinase [Labilithrix sp.]